MGELLRGQVAIVTGAGRGIGRAVALRLAEAGASVAAVARTAGQLDDTVGRIIEAGGRALVARADVREQRAVTAVVERVERELGPISLLVNGAGTGAAVGPIWEVDADLWWQDVEVVLRGAQLFTRAVLPSMVERRAGRIVNLTSRSGATATPYHTGYACSRAALFTLTEAIAKETAPHGVCAFALTPGVVRTALTEALLRSEEGRRWLPELGRLVADGSAWVEAERVGDAVVALACGRADALSGRWVHAGEDVDALVEEAAAIGEHELRVLRLRS